MLALEQNNTSALPVRKAAGTGRRLKLEGNSKCKPATYQQQAIPACVINAMVQDCLNNKSQGFASQLKQEKTTIVPEEDGGSRR